MVIAVLRRMVTVGVMSGVINAVMTGVVIAMVTVWMTVTMVVEIIYYCNGDCKSENIDCSGDDRIGSSIIDW